MARSGHFDRLSQNDRIGRRARLHRLHRVVLDGFRRRKSRDRVMRYMIAVVSWTLLALLAIAASRPARHEPAPMREAAPVREAAPATNWSRASQGFPAFGDAGPIH